MSQVCDVTPPKVSLIVPAYNAAPYLGATLASVYGGTFQSFEIIVIDDGSSDATAEIAQLSGDKTRVIQQKNMGMSPARNKALELSRGEFIAFLDSDDLWHPRKLEYQVDVLNDNTQYDLCYTGFKNWHGGPTQEFMSQEVSKNISGALSGWVYHQMILTHQALPSSILMRRAVYEKLGPFPCTNQKTDDWEYFVIASRYFQFVKLQDAFVLYRQHSASLSKRIPELNDTELMRDSLLNRFGTEQQIGRSVDLVELARRRYIGRKNFADMHVVSGGFVRGMQAFLWLFVAGPNRGETVIVALKAGSKRLTSFILKLCRSICQ